MDILLLGQQEISQYDPNHDLYIEYLTMWGNIPSNNGHMFKPIFILRCYIWKIGEVSHFRIKVAGMIRYDSFLNPLHSQIFLTLGHHSSIFLGLFFKTKLQASAPFARSWGWVFWKKRIKRNKFIFEEIFIIITQHQIKCQMNGKI